MDCEGCGYFKETPQLMRQNEDAYIVWSIVQGQVIAGFDKIIDINHQSVWKIIDEYENEHGKIEKRALENDKTNFSNTTVHEIERREKVKHSKIED